MKRSAFALLVLAATQLVGCAAFTPPVWNKPDGTQEEFASDRYNCLQQSQQRVSGAYVNQYGGAANDEVITNGQLFGACMNARGWYLQRPQ